MKVEPEQVIADMLLRIRAEERERIIALLNDMKDSGTIQTYRLDSETHEYTPSSVYVDREAAIKLIKGESK